MDCKNIFKIFFIEFQKTSKICASRPEYPFNFGDWMHANTREKYLEF